MIKLEKSLCRSSSIPLALIVAVFVCPASWPDAQAQEAQGADVIEEIVVTSRKREEALQDIPDTITVLTEAVIEHAGIDSIEDISLLVPGMNVMASNNISSKLVNVRGIMMQREMDPSVSVIIDGVQLSQFNQFSQTLTDIQQVEVLKGPQGSLWGRGSIAGAINITTKAPSDEFEGKVMVGAGQGYEATGVISGPITDTLAYRIHANWEKHDGTLENVNAVDLDQRRSFNGRGRLVWTPTANFTGEVIAAGSYLNGGTYYWIGVPNPGQENNFDLVNESFPTTGEADVYLEDYTVKMDWHTAFATVTSITNRSLVDDEYFGRGAGGFTDSVPGIFADLDFFEFPIAGAGNQSFQVDTWSQELRLTSNDDSARLRWQAGAYMIQTDRELKTFLSVNFPNFLTWIGNVLAGLPRETGLNPAATLDAPLASTSNTEDNFAYAFFGHVDYDWTDKLTLSVGLRYDVDEREQLDNFSLIENKEDFDLIQPKFSLSYRWSDDMMTYATIARGFRSGGFNAAAGAFAPRLYGKEELWNYEIGLKSTFWDGRGAFNGAVFYTDLENHQERVFDATIGAPIVFNIPESELYGVESELNMQLTDHWDVFLGVSYTHSEVTEFTPVVVFDLLRGPLTYDAVGEQLPFVTHLNFNASAQYEHPISGDLNFIGRVDFSHRDDKNWWLGGLFQADAVSLVNIRASLEWRENWTMTAWSENLFNEDYIQEFQSAGQIGFPEDFQYPAAERRYGVRLTYRF